MAASQVCDPTSLTSSFSLPAACASSWTAVGQTTTSDGNLYQFLDKDFPSTITVSTMSSAEPCLPHTGSMTSACPYAFSTDPGVEYLSCPSGYTWVGNEKDITYISDTSSALESLYCCPTYAPISISNSTGTDPVTYCMGNTSVPANVGVASVPDVTLTYTSNGHTHHSSAGTFWFYAPQLTFIQMTALASELETTQTTPSKSMPASSPIANDTSAAGAASTSRLMGSHHEELLSVGGAVGISVASVGLAIGCIMLGLIVWRRSRKLKKWSIVDQGLEVDEYVDYSARLNAHKQPRVYEMDPYREPTEMEEQRRPGELHS